MFPGWKLIRIFGHAGMGGEIFVTFQKVFVDTTAVAVQSKLTEG